jgi:hypothetical protein
MEAPEVRDVAMLIGGIVLVLEPLLELPVTADAVRRDARPQRAELLAQLRIHVENPARGHDGREEAPYDLMIHRRSHHEPAVVGRVAGAGDQPAGGRVFHQSVHEEERGPFHQRVGPGTEELPVAVEEIAVSEMQGEPRTAGARCRDSRC